MGINAADRKVVLWPIFACRWGGVRDEAGQAMRGLCPHLDVFQGDLCSAVHRSAAQLDAGTDGQFITEM